MRRRFSTLASLLLWSVALSAPPAAHAGFLQSATWTTSFNGVTVDLSGSATSYAGSLQGFVSGNGVSYLDGGVTNVSVGLLLQLASDRVFAPTHPPFPFPMFFGAQLDGGALQIDATPGAALVIGGIDARLTASRAVHTKASMTLGSKLYAAPIQIGVTGDLWGYFPILGVTHYATVDYYGWTLGTRTFTATRSGVALPDVVVKGAWDLSPVNPVMDIFGGAGTITLVAPTRITIDGPLRHRTVSLTTLTLNFGSDGPYETIPVPEARALLLLAAGGLVIACARRPR